MIGVKSRRDNRAVTVLVRCLILAAALAAGQPAAAQQHEPPNGVFLVAKPGLLDPNFRQTVVLVTQAQDSSTVGVILNRPTRLTLQQILPEELPSAGYRDPVFFGGPVMREALVAVFLADTAPAAPAFHVLKDLYLTMHPDNLRLLLADGAKRFRIYAGFSSWAPRQLESEFQRDGWYVLPADVETIFRSDMEGVWQELVRRAENRPVNSDPNREGGNRVGGGVTSAALSHHRTCGSASGGS